jgi:hypothetical protein
MGERSPLDSALSAVAAGVFAPLSRLRGARAVHAHGAGFQAALALRDGPGLALMPAMGAPRPVRALVRLSPSFDIPRPLPDFLGLALKLPDLHGPGRDQDFLLVTAIATWVPLPARSYAGRTFSSLLPYRSGGRLVVPGALSSGWIPATGEHAHVAATHAALDGTLRLTVAVAAPRGPFVLLGELTPERELAPPEVQGLRFDPFHTAASLVPAAGPLNALRRGAYRASQRARPDVLP